MGRIDPSKSYSYSIVPKGKRTFKKQLQENVNMNVDKRDFLYSRIK